MDLLEDRPLQPRLPRATECPPQSRSCNALEDALPFFGDSLAMVDHEWYERPQQTARPMPCKAALGDFPVKLSDFSTNIGSDINAVIDVEVEEVHAQE